MNYIELINKFWTANEEHSFRTSDIALYFYLLKVNNDCSWKEYFKRNNKKVEGDLSMSFNTLKDSRNRLKIAGLLFFKTVNGNANVTYSFAYTSSLFDEVTDEVFTRFSRGFHEVSTSKDKLKKTKEYKGEKEKTPSPENPIFKRIEERKEIDILECYNQVIENQQYLETIAMNNHLGTLEASIDWLNIFLKKLQNEGIETKSINDFKSHFGRWLPIELKKDGANRKTNQSESIASTIADNISRFAAADVAGKN